MSLPAEKLEGLPYGWESRLVKDILVIVDGDRGSNYPKKKDFFDSGYCLFLSTKNVRPNGFLFEENQFITKERHELLRKGKLERGDIVFTSRGTIGNIAHYDERVEYDCVRINSGMFIIRGFQEHITEKYLEYYMRSPYVLSQIGRLKSGSAQPQLPIRDFQKFEINFPKDKEQQKRIVAKIEELFSHIDAGIAALKKAKQLLKQYRQSVLKAAVTGELTKEWREAHKDDAQGSANVAGGRTPGATEAKYETAQELLERILKERRQKWEEQQLEQFKANGKVPKDDRWIEKYKDPELPNTKNSEVIPESWTYCGIEMLLLPDKAAMKTGPFGSLLKKHEHKTEGVPVLGIENIASMQFVPGSKIHITNAKAKELDGYKVVEGDILISRSGTVGEVCVVPDMGEARISTNLMKLSLMKNGLNPVFFTYLFNGSPFVLGQVAELCKGSTRDFLNQDILKKLLLVLPPYEEQLEIISQVEDNFYKLERLDKEIDLQLLKTEKNKQSILADAFCGKFTNSNNLAKDEQCEEAMVI